MADLREQYQTALDKASECELLGSLTVDRKKREAWRSKAQFYYSIADELRAKLETLPARKERHRAGLTPAKDFGPER